MTILNLCLQQLYFILDIKLNKYGDYYVFYVLTCHGKIIGTGVPKEYINDIEKFNNWKVIK
jgi:uncharacterized protein YjfI (DUF2170 family)